jgi:hypothetical protein
LPSTAEICAGDAACGGGVCSLRFTTAAIAATRRNAAIGVLDLWRFGRILEREKLGFMPRLGGGDGELPEWCGRGSVSRSPEFQPLESVLKQLQHME